MAGHIEKRLLCKFVFFLSGFWNLSKYSRYLRVFWAISLLDVRAAARTQQFPFQTFLQSFLKRCSQKSIKRLHTLRKLKRIFYCTISNITSQTIHRPSFIKIGALEPRLQHIVAHPLARNFRNFLKYSSTNLLKLCFFGFIQIQKFLE